MKLKTLTAVLIGFAISGCGGGGGDDDGNTVGVSGTNGTSGSTETSATPQSTPVTAESAEYLNQTYQTGQSQQQQSEVVAGKSTTPEVQALAQQVSIEVNVINQQITQLTQNSNVTINNNLTSQQQTQINNINTLSGSELDRTYVRGLVSSYRQLLAATMAEAQTGSNLRVRQNAAANTLLIEQRVVSAQEVLFVLVPTDYLAAAFESGLLEIRLSQLALQQATNTEVRQFAQMMIDQHTRVNAQISALATQKSVSLPTELGADKQQIFNMVSNFTGADFDKAYMDRNVMIHAQDVSKTTVVSERSTDAEVRSLATATLPLLQQHFQMALNIATSIQASAFYQLSQNVVSELQIAQLAQARTTNAQVTSVAQETSSQNQEAFAQIVQLAQQRNQIIPLTIPPGQVQAILQLLRISGADSTQLISLINAQTAQNLQTAQSLQTNSDASISTLARARVSALEARAGGQATASGSAGGSSDTNGAGTTGTSDASGTTDTTGTSDTSGSTDATGTAGSSGTGASGTTVPGTSGSTGAGTTDSSGSTDATGTAGTSGTGTGSTGTTGSTGSTGTTGSQTTTTATASAGTT